MVLAAVDASSRSGDRWAAQMIRDNVSDLDVRAVVDRRPPDDTDVALAWLRSSATVVVEAVANVGPETLVPTFLGPRTGVWWLRRRLHEATVHRADVAIARTSAADPTAYALIPELAADGIDEWIERLVEFQRQGTMPPVLQTGQRIAVSGYARGSTSKPHVGDSAWSVSLVIVVTPCQPPQYRRLGP